MGIFYAGLSISFIILFVINIIWVAVNLYLWSMNGIQYLLEGMNFAERVYGSILLKWILLADLIWIILALIFALIRKSYMTDPKLHYLSFNPISNPKLCVIIPTFNEEKNVEQVVTDYKNQKFVEEIILIDNPS